MSYQRKDSFIRISILGDFCPINRFEDALIHKSIDEIFDSELIKLFHEADYVIANLECPLLSREKSFFKPIEKTGPVLGVDGKTIKGIKDLGIYAFNLGNNHIKDYGDDGIISTMTLLQKNGIKFFGAGNSREEAEIPLILEKNGIKVAVCSLADKEFSYSEDNEFTVNAIEYDFPLYLQNIKNSVDFLICLVHKGHYMYAYPSPNNYKLAHLLIDLGVDTIIFQHSHTIGAIEIYKDKPIFYGQGNFLFDFGDNVPEAWAQSLLISFDLMNNKKMKYKLIPTVQNPKDAMVTMGGDLLKKSIFSKIREYQSVIRKEGESGIMQQWHRYVKSNRKSVTGMFFIGDNVFFKIIRRLELDLLKFFPKSQRLVIRNYLRSHDNRELLESIFELSLIDNNE